MFPEDLAQARRDNPNVSCVKEATGDLENMRRTRACCGEDFLILSGDDGITYELMTDPGIIGNGAISVMSNIAPGPVTKMVKLLNEKNLRDAKLIFDALKPLFDLVTVKTVEKTPYGDVTCRSRNPVPVKTLMQILGMPSGPCRRPLGKMTRAGAEKVLEAARGVNKKNPEIFTPVADFFGVDIEKRLNDETYLQNLVYNLY
jgi:4-hydroxy-tetrahydrodipicolinate synthase